MDVECPMSKERRLSMQSENGTNSDFNGCYNDINTYHSAENNDQNSHNISDDLRQFDVLDEVQGDDTGSEDENDGKQILKNPFASTLFSFKHSLSQTMIQVTLMRPILISIICWMKDCQKI